MGLGDWIAGEFLSTRMSDAAHLPSKPQSRLAGIISMIRVVAQPLQSAGG